MSLWTWLAREMPGSMSKYYALMWYIILVRWFSVWNNMFSLVRLTYSSDANFLILLCILTKQRPAKSYVNLTACTRYNSYISNMVFSETQRFKGEFLLNSSFASVPCNLQNTASSGIDAEASEVKHQQNKRATEVYQILSSWFIWQVDARWRLFTPRFSPKWLFKTKAPGKIKFLLEIMAPCWLQLLLRRPQSCTKNCSGLRLLASQSKTAPLGSALFWILLAWDYWCCYQLDDNSIVGTSWRR